MVYDSKIVSGHVTGTIVGSVQRRLCFL